MKQDEIIELVQEAGIVQFNDGFIDITKAELDKFAKLVAAKEREACAKVCEELPAPDIYSDTDKCMWDVTCIDCATAILERGQA
jgi:hypothetical protein